MKKLLLTSALFLLVLFIPQNTLAQGTYTCQWLVSSCNAGTIPQLNNCDSGYRPGSDCSQFSNATTCSNQTFDCVPDTGQTACAEDRGGTCKLSCNPSNETTVGGFGTLGCVNPKPRCCVAKAESNDSDIGPLKGCPGGESINTAIGCIPVGDTNQFVGFLLRWAMGVGGGIAFLLIVYAGIMISTSSGNPERLQAGRELLTSAVAGLIMLIFSIFILRIIGVDILGIPGLN